MAGPEDNALAHNLIAVVGNMSAAWYSYLSSEPLALALLGSGLLAVRMVIVRRRHR
jgi:hypothetical protein